MPAWPTVLVSLFCAAAPLPEPARCCCAPRFTSHSLLPSPHSVLHSPTAAPLIYLTLVSPRRTGLCCAGRRACGIPQRGATRRGRAQDQDGHGQGARANGTLWHLVQLLHLEARCVQQAQGRRGAIAHEAAEGAPNLLFSFAILVCSAETAQSS